MFPQRKVGTLCTASRKYNGAAAMENIMVIPQKLKIEFPFVPASPLLGIYSKEFKIGA